MTGNSLIEILPPAGRGLTTIHPLVADLGPNAEFAWNEFFGAHIRNRNTRMAYLRAVTRFLAWVNTQGVVLQQIQPGMVGQYLDQHCGSLPTKKLHLSAIRAFFDVLVNRHIIGINPASTVRGERYQVVEGKTPEISGPQARSLLNSINPKRPVEFRDRALIATLIYTAARAGAIASLKMKDFTWDGTQYAFRFLEKGGKSRSIPIRHDLQKILLEYVGTFAWNSEPKDSAFFRSVAGRTGQLTNKPMRNTDICRMVKRRLHEAGLPENLSPHSFRVATVTDLLTQGVSLEDVQYLAGHADPRTTRLYDRRQKTVTRNTVERISI